MPPVLSDVLCVRRPEFAAEPYEVSGYLTTLKPTRREKLQKLLYVYTGAT